MTLQTKVKKMVAYGRRQVITKTPKAISQSSLYRDFPFCRDYEVEDLERRWGLAKTYADYIENVSKDSSAASLELGYFMAFLCERVQPKSALDLGSGFSSYVLRLYQANQNPQCVVYSVDDDAMWLEKTADYLKKNSLPIENLMSWTDFLEIDPPKFDLVLHDIGRHAGRVESFPRVLELVDPEGLMLIDDMHKPHHREPIRKMLDEAGARHYDLSALTLDKFERYAWLATQSKTASR